MVAGPAQEPGGQLHHPPGRPRLDPTLPEEGQRDDRCQHRRKGRHRSDNVRGGEGKRPHPHPCEERRLRVRGHLGELPEDRAGVSGAGAGGRVCGLVRALQAARTHARERRDEERRHVSTGEDQQRQGAVAVADARGAGPAHRIRMQLRQALGVH